MPECATWARARARVWTRVWTRAGLGLGLGSGPQAECASAKPAVGQSSTAISLPVADSVM